MKIFLFILLIFFIIIASVFFRQSMMRKSTSSIKINFAQTGHLVSGEKGGWGLLYEEPGKPALKVLLVFVADSVCNFGNGDEACFNTKGFVGTVGDSVRVEGEKQGDKLTVSRITSIKF